MKNFVKNTDQKIQRRSVLKAFVFLPAVSLFGSLIYDVARAAAAIPANYFLATANDPTPKAMQYAEVASKANPAMRKDQTAICSSCAQYGKTGPEFKHPKNGKVATCELYLKGQDKMYVKSGGWCLAYQKKV